MNEEIISLKNEAIAQISQTKSLTDLETLRVAYLGKNGKFTQLVKRIADFPIKFRKEYGLILNESKLALNEQFVAQKSKLTEGTRTWFDPTIPGIKPRRGHLHVVTKAIEEIADVFEKLGFERVRYPEVEWDWYSFGSLNFTKYHPARDNWETFFVDLPEDKKFGPMVLTPHTSSGQLREMERILATDTHLPPIRMINIAKCYRRQSDPSHYPMFHQFEGLVVDKNISLTHLKGTLDYFAKTFFGPKRLTRLRPYNFPFTEPSFEVDVTCGICLGKGCKVCKAGWLELGGAGMVHPNVLKNGGIDPSNYSGFAFGWGVERVMMMKSGLSIPDIRLLYSTDLRILNQF